MNTRSLLFGLLAVVLVLSGCTAPAPVPAPSASAPSAPAATVSSPTSAATSQPTVAPTARPLTKIRIISGGTANLPIFCYQTVGYAENLGFFKEEGIELESVGLEGGTAALQALIAGKGDFASSSPASVVQLLGKGTDPGVKIVYAHGRNIHWEIDVAEDSSITKISDLKGKKIGVTSFGASPYLGIQAMLKEVGLDPKTNAEFIATGTGAPMVNALKTKQVDVLALTNYEAASGEILGMKFKRIPLTPTVEKTFGLGMVTTDGFIKNNPDALVGFLRALAKGTIFMFDNPEACVKLHWKVFPDSKPKGLSDEEALKQAVYLTVRNGEGYEIRANDPNKKWGYVDPSTWQNIFKVFELPNADVNQVFTLQYIDAANKFDQDALHKFAKGYQVK